MEGNGREYSSMGWIGRKTKYNTNVGHYWDIIRVTTGILLGSVLGYY